MLAWCSSLVITISSPSPTLRRPQACATRLMASVVPRTKTISLAEGALRKRRTFSRAASNASVDARRQRVRGAVNVGVLVLVEVRDAVDHGLRLLRRGRVVEPDQGTAVDIFLKDWEVAAEDMGVELPGTGDRGQRDGWHMLRRQQAEIEGLAVGAIGQGIGAGRCAQAFIKEIVAAAGKTRVRRRAGALAAGWLPKPSAAGEPM